jgi:nickel-dependent lactate racemase
MTDTTHSLAYGRHSMQITIPSANLIGVIEPQDPAGEHAGKHTDEVGLLSEALAHPIGTLPLRQLVQPGQAVAIVTSDLTRPCPSEKLLPFIAQELEAADVPNGDVFIVLGLGLHRPMTDEEIDRTVSPEIRRRYRVYNHNPENTELLGYTTRGTPVEFFRPLVEADFRICLGNIEFHYFAGYSGGAKAILPGCASRLAVTANHAMMVLPEAAAGRLEDNPLRQDIEEAVSMLGVDFILNVVVDQEHRIQAAFAGDVTAAHRKGCEYVAQRGKVKISQKADIVIASPGGFPKDINFYQAHKAMEGAKDFLRDGGVLILVAECGEGFGEQTMEAWLLESGSPAEVIMRLQRGFVLGGHKAAAIAAIRQRADVYVVSALPEAKIKRAGMHPFTDAQRAVEAAFEQLGRDSRVLLIPQAVSMVPEMA